MTDKITRINSMTKSQMKGLMSTKLPRSVDDDFPIFQAGVEEGKRITRQDVLTQLQTQYMKEDIQRHSVEGQLILKIASELKTFIDTL